MLRLEQYGAIDHFYPQTDVYAMAATLVYALGTLASDSRTITEETIRDTLPPALPRDSRPGYNQCPRP